MTLRQTRSLLTGALTVALAAYAAGCTKDEPNNPPATSTVKVTSFTASRTSVARGEKVTLSWVVEKATGIAITAAPGGSVTTSANLSGSVESAALTEATTFTLTATGDDGKTDSKTVMVSIDTSRVVITKFEAQPNPAPLNGATRLVWETGGADMVQVVEGATEITRATGAMALSGSFRATLTAASTTFRLLATGAAGTAEQMVTVTAEAPPELLAFRVTPPSFSGASQSVSVTYTARNASSINLLANGAAVAGFPMTAQTATVSVTVTMTTLFELVVSSGGGEIRARATVARTTPETEPNDAFGTATALTTGAASALINPAGDEDWYSIVVPANGNVLAETSPPTAADDCFDTILHLYGPDGTTELAMNDDVSTGVYCSRIDPALLSGARNLSAGTYYLRVRPYSTTATGAYSLAVVIGTASCGNGIQENGEQCDDGNSTNGDRCSTTCQIEVDGEITGTGGMVTVSVPPEDSAIIRLTLTAGQGVSATTTGCTFDTAMALFDSNILRLGTSFDDATGGMCAEMRFPQDGYNLNLPAGTYYLVVGDEGATPTGGSVTVTVQIHDPVCGNGAIETLHSEQCDDGNTMSSDGCSATCTVEPAGMITGPTGGMVFTNTGREGKQDFYQVTMNAAGFITARTGNPTLGECNTTDLEITLMDSSFNTLGADTIGCPLFNGQDFTQVQAGTYYVMATVTATTASVPYQIDIRAVGLGCGNGVLEMGEVCDDSNTTAGDGCSATCQYEPLGTVMGPGGAATTFSNELDTAGEEDIFQVNMSAAGYVLVDSGSPTLGMCAMDVDLEIELLDSTFTSLGGPFSGCGSITGADSFANVAQGTYYVRVRVSFLSAVTTVAAYQISIHTTAAGCGNGVVEPAEGCDDGNTAAGDGCSAMCALEGAARAESEPNNDTANADASGAQRNRTVVESGAITPMGDHDVYSLTVPAGQTATLTVRTFTNLADATECMMADTVVSLLDSMGNVLTENDDLDPGNNLCSLIDNDTAATNLAPGTYYIQVIRYNDSAEIPQYYLSIQVR